MTTLGYLVIEWNQAGRPDIHVSILYEMRHEAQQVADDAQAHYIAEGRRERFTVARVEGGDGS